MLNSAVIRFQEKIILDNNDCWIWRGRKNNKGYGMFGFEGKRVFTHRWAYEHYSGLKIPYKMQIDHLCRVRLCCNPKHLEVVTNQENCQRGKRLITHCQRGHEYNEENTSRRPSGWRDCKLCNRINARKSNDKRRAECIARGETQSQNRVRRRKEKLG